MSHTAWSVKLSSTLVYGATSRWKSDDRTTREKAGTRDLDILIADHRALEVDMMSGSRLGDDPFWLPMVGWRQVG